MTDKVAETWVTSPARLIGRGALEACLVHIYPSGPSMGKRYALGDDPVTIGRSEGCEIRIQDNSVSRRHAKIEPAAGGYSVSDLGSTNGTFVNDATSSGAQPMKDGDYLRVGNCIYRFLTGGNIEAEYHEEIYRLTIIDGLTQIHNHRYLMDFLERELARSVRHKRPLSLLMIDLDRFKAINDEYGHLGDYILREVSERLRHSIRREDLFARYGGEEFCLVLVETHHEQALEVAERIRTAVESGTYNFDNRPIQPTVSVGVYTTEGEPPLNPTDLIRLADERMYAAKSCGRNQVVG